MSRAERRAAERKLRGIDRDRKREAETLRRQAVALRVSTPAPGETVAEALAAVETFLAVKEADPLYQVVGRHALDELRGLRDDLRARAG